jgi:hypothetical protein
VSNLLNERMDAEMDAIRPKMEIGIEMTMLAERTMKRLGHAVGTWHGVTEGKLMLGLKCTTCGEGAEIAREGTEGGEYMVLFLPAFLCKGAPAWENVPGAEMGIRPVPNDAPNGGSSALRRE